MAESIAEAVAEWHDPDGAVDDATCRGCGEYERDCSCDNALVEVLHATLALQAETHLELVEMRQALGDLVTVLDDVGGFLWPRQQQALWWAKELLK